jgi:two-component system, NtrC family, sensor histidine kinase HydH
VFFAIGLVGVTAILIGALSYTRARRALETTARTNLVLLAHDAAAHVRRELENRAADITNWAHLEMMRAVIYHDVDKELAQFLEQQVHTRPTYTGAACVDRNGNVVATAGTIGNVLLSEATTPRRVSIAAQRDNPLLRLQTAVVNPERPSEVIGALVVLVDARRILETIDVSTQGDPRLVSLALRDVDGGAIADSGRDAPGSRHAVLHAQAPIGPLPAVDGADLEVVVSEGADVAFADIVSLRATLLRTGLLVAVVGAILAALLAWRMTLPIRQLTAAVRDVAERGEPVLGTSFPESGGEVGVLASAFRSMMDSLASAQREALTRSRLAFLGEIAANVAHEVRTPLSVLKMAAQALARGGIPPAEQRELAATAAAEVDRLNTVVTGLVDLARPKPVHYARQRIGPIVDRAVTFFGPLAAKDGVTLERAGSDDGVLVRGNADQLYQVLLNLLQNALQAMRGPGVVTVRVLRDEGSVTIAVEDSGPGIAADVLPRIFSPFVTTKTDGAGLGLAIVKRLVEEHGGTVGAENRRRGACVWMRLPVRKDGA